MTGVIITGGAGFVAAHLARRFQAEGCQVVLTDIRPPAPDGPADRLPAGVSFERVDLTDAEAVIELMRKWRPSGVVHAGGVVGPAASNADPRHTVRVNVGGTQNLLDGLREVGGRFTFLSTATIYGTRPDLRPLAETDAADPVGIYDATKFMAEVLVQSYRRSYGLDTCRVRFGFPYGLGQSIDQYFLPRVMDGEKFIEPAGRDHPSDFTYIDDLIDGIWRTQTTPVLPHDLYNITGGVLRTRGDFAGAVRAAVPDAVIELGPGLQPGRHLRGPCELDRARADLGYQPRYSIEEGVAAWAEQLRAAARVR